MHETPKPPATLPEVVARLREIASHPPHSDGVACFARLYLAVTEAAARDLDRSAFANPVFLARLDVVFANLFLDAVDAYARDPRTAPRAWAPLFSCRAQRGIAPLQFAFAGMNAHINRDLPVALVATCAELGLEPSAGSAEHGDFERVNVVLRTVEARVKASYVTGWAKAIDRILHRFDRIDDVVAMWNVERARDAAWTNGEALWALRGAPELSAQFLLALDRMVGFAGRGLLVPADTFVRSLARRLYADAIR